MSDQEPDANPTFECYACATDLTALVVHEVLAPGAPVIAAAPGHVVWPVAWRVVVVCPKDNIENSFGEYEQKNIALVEGEENP